MQATNAAVEVATRTIEYTHFNKVERITQGIKTMEFTYDPGQQRTKMIYKVDNITQYTRYYLGDYEKTNYANGDVKEIYYISSGNGLTAMYIIDNGVGSTYYVHKDYLGSNIAGINPDIIFNYSYYQPWWHGIYRIPRRW